MHAWCSPGAQECHSPASPIHMATMPFLTSSQERHSGSVSTVHPFRPLTTSLQKRADKTAENSQKGLLATLAHGWHQGTWISGGFLRSLNDNRSTVRTPGVRAPMGSRSLPSESPSRRQHTHCTSFSPINTYYVVCIVCTFKLFPIIFFQTHFCNGHSYC